MPNKTAAPFEIPYPDQDDKPPNLEVGIEGLAKRLHELLGKIGTGQLVVPGGAGDKGKLLLVDNTGAAAFAAMKGDATLAGDGTLTIGKAKILTEMLADLVVTTAKMANKSVTEPKYGDASLSSRALKPTYGEKISSADYTAEENPGFVPGMTLELKPTVDSVLLLWHFWRVRFNKVQTNVSAVVYKNYGGGAKEDSDQLDIPSEQATLDIYIPGMTFTTFSIAANENAIIQPRVFGPGAKTVIPAGGGRYMYMLMAA